MRNSDISVPVIAVLTRNGNGYFAFTDKNMCGYDDSMNEITDFKKIVSERKISDIIFLQNYETGISGSAIPFVKYADGGYTWKMVTKS